jgi:hypothetical protein
MKTYSKVEVQKAINELCLKLGITINSTLQREYQNGFHPTLLSYEKVEKPKIIVPAIQKYLMGAQTFCNQPTNFYDIFRANRHVTFIQHLNREIDIVREKVLNSEERINRLVKLIDYDDFESCLFEILTAGAYLRLNKIRKVEFIIETSSKSPDLRVVIDLGEYFVECKKFDRTVDYDTTIRDAVRDNTKATLVAFAQTNKSAVIELTYFVDPCECNSVEILEICTTALKKNAYIRTNRLAAKVTTLQCKPLNEFALYPSPKYFWERYKFRHNSEWKGIVPLINCRFAYHIDIPDQNPMPSSTWLDNVEWECAIKWKIENEDTLWRIKRLSYDRLFKALDQLKSKSEKSIVHAWIERDYPTGNRQAELIDFLNRLKKNMRDIFSWIVFNETCLEVTPNGLFDFIEHAHSINGPTAFRKEPPVTNIFITEEGMEEGTGDFGVGKNLPDLDTIG